MKKLTLIFVLLVSYLVSAQHTISGTFSPASDFSWLIAYRLKSGTQNYIADTAIKKGAFNLTIPENAPSGMYRLVYAVPQEEFYFDIIYNGKEDIELTFNINDGAKFIISEENILYSSHSEAIGSIEQKIVDFYLSGETNKKVFSDLSEQLKDIQKLYEQKSEGLIAHEFISANTLPIPLEHLTIQDYVAFKKTNYFNGVDMGNPVLLASTFLTDKISNYVFTALPIETLSQEETEKAIINNVELVNTMILENTGAYRLHIQYNLWSQAAASNLNMISDFIYNSYLKELAITTGNKDIIDQIDVHNRLRLGAKAPEIIWKEGQDEKSLSDLNDAENYVLVFWSSTCSHCLKELPALHKELKGNSKVITIAIGLEDDDISWQKESEKLSNFKHAIALGKWQSDYAKLYDIHATPSYFILDREKRIIAKPENDKALVEFLKKE